MTCGETDPHGWVCGLDAGHTGDHCDFCYWWERRPLDYLAEDWSCYWDGTDGDRERGVLMALGLVVALVEARAWVAREDYNTCCICHVGLACGRDLYMCSPCLDQYRF